MTVTATPVFVQTPNLGVNSITTASGTSAVTVVTGGTNGSKVVGFSANNNTTAAAIVTLSLSTGGGTAKRLLNLSINAAATDQTGNSIDMLNSTIVPGLPVDNDGQHYLFLPSASYTLTASATAQLSTAANSTGKTVDLTSVYADF